MISIRTMTENDIPRAAELEKMIFTDPWSEKVYRETFKIPDVEYVAVCDDEAGQEMVGAAGVRNIVGTGEITNVMLLPEYRGRGIGRQMLEEVIRRGRRLGAKDFTLEVRKSNANAIRLYEKLGFESAGIRPQFYRNPDEDAVIMWLYTQ